jgi:hypothetical protein
MDMDAVGHSTKGSHDLDFSILLLLIIIICSPMEAFSVTLAMPFLLIGAWDNAEI